MKDNHVNKTDRLPDAELDVMQVLWRSTEPMKTAKILDALNQEKNWTMSTLQALLSRLEKRGFIESYKHMHNKYYTPIVEQDGYQLKETKSFLKRVYSNSFKSMVAALIDNEELDETDMQEITDMLRKAGDKNV